MPDQEHYSFEIQGLASELQVARFSGEEGVSELFHFDVTVLSEDAGIAFADAVGKPALLTLHGDAEPRHVHGVVARFEQGDAGKKVTTYLATVVPKAWRLQHRHDCRIFQEKSAPDIVKAVLEGAGLASGDDFAFSLQGSYVARTYCVQWRESDWAFVCRLMEDEGIFFYFEHHEDKHVLTFADKPGAHTPIAGAAAVVYKPSLGALVEGEYVQRFRVAEETRTGKVDVRDYNFVKPATALTGTKEGTVDTALAVYDWMNADAQHDAAGRAAVRLEERAALRRVGRGEGGVERFTAGFTFELQEHPREDLNVDWILARVEHQGLEPTRVETSGQEARYENRFSCVPATVALRPPLSTPRPTIRGLQTAMVVGPAGEEIHTDEHGRIKVQFQWDRLGKNDDKSSCWMRVAQAWAGPQWGALYIPRIGQEVLVDFLDGDPDRPMVVGAVYHGTNVPPYALPSEKTKSTLKSNSSPGGGGHNELRFEDKAGSEEVYLRSQKDHFVEVLHDEKRTVGHDDLVDVTHDRTVHVGHDRQTTIDHDDALHVKHDRKVDVDNDETITIGKKETISVGDDTAVSLGKNLTFAVAKNVTSSVDGDVAESVSGKVESSIGGDHTLDVSGASTVTVGGDHADEAKLTRTIKAGDKITIECGDAKVVIEKNGNITVSGKDLSVSATGKVEIKAATEVHIESSATLNVKASGPAKIESSATVAVKGAVVNVN